jgi:hypothetical protein
LWHALPMSAREEDALRAEAPPPGLPDGDARQGEPLLTDGDVRALDAQYSPDERLLNEFIRLHPMLNLEATNRDVLQKLCNMVERQPIRVSDLPVVSKSYEDMFLRPPRTRHGERPCVMGEQCFCNVIAQMRFGRGTTRGFVGTEFLVPAARDAWLVGKGLPERRQKCLVCLRYFTTYAYLTARSDPDFALLLRQLGPQTHANVVSDGAEATTAADDDNDNDDDLDGLDGLDGDTAGQAPHSKRRRGAEAPAPAPAPATLATHGGLSADPSWHDANTAADELPSHANRVDTTDGYRRDAMLFVDEESLDAAPMRTARIGALMWRPFVRFSTSHYRYAVRAGEKCIEQVGVGVDQSPPRRHLNGVPPPAAAERAVGMSRTGA